MSREEEIVQAANENYPSLDSEKSYEGFKDGAKWADKHPREGFWNSKKVIEWIALHAELYGGFNQCKLNSMCEDLIKAMEE